MVDLSQPSEHFSWKHLSAAAEKPDWWAQGEWQVAGHKYAPHLSLSSSFQLFLLVLQPHMSQTEEWTIGEVCGQGKREQSDISRS